LLLPAAVHEVSKQISAIPTRNLLYCLLLLAPTRVSRAEECLYASTSAITVKGTPWSSDDIPAGGKGKLWIGEKDADMFSVITTTRLFREFDVNSHAIMMTAPRFWTYLLKDTET